MSDTNGTGTAVVERADSTARSMSALGDEQGFKTAQRIAHALASSSVVPKDYQDNLANVLVAMEYANRLEVSVLAVMQNLDVIHGRPSLRSTFLIGTVNASGRFTPIRFRWEGEPSTDEWGCRAVAKDRESGEECLGALITIALAKAEGWYGRSGSKWKTIPEQMLMYRSAAWWTRVYAPELSLGFHTSDEMADIGPAPQERIQNVAAALDGPDVAAALDGPDVAERPIVGEVIEEEEDTSPPSKGELAKLEELRDTCRASDLMTSADETEIAEALKLKDGLAVRSQIHKMNRLLLAKAGSDQGSLLGEEG